jgi:hypothetical protein
VREPTELGSVLEPIAVLSAAVAKARGGSLEVTLPDDMPPSLAIDATAVRAALTIVLLAEAERGATVRCIVVYEPAAVVVEVATNQEVVLSGTVATDIEACGITVCPVPSGITLRIPRTGTAAP